MQVTQNVNQNLVRFWNLANALDSFIVHGAGSETVNPALVSYRWATDFIHCYSFNIGS